MERFLILLLLSGCACPPVADIGFPPEPVLQDIPPFDVSLEKEPPMAVRLYLAELADNADESDDLVLIRREELMRPIYQCAANDLAWSEYSDKLEARIRLSNER